jgi:hypothetical protein
MYFLDKRTLTIHSEDRNIDKFPDRSQFEVELPQDYLRVQSVKLVAYSLPLLDSSGNGGCGNGNSNGIGNGIAETDAIYLEIDGLNCIDELAPYQQTRWTQTTNGTNSTVNGAFFKVILANPNRYQWSDPTTNVYKWFNPPMERLRRMRLSWRTHSGQPVRFGENWNITLEISVLMPKASVGGGLDHCTVIASDTLERLS